MHTKPLLPGFVRWRTERSVRLRDTSAVKGGAKMSRTVRLAAVLALLAGAGCASLPDTRFLSERYEVQAAKIENARGPLSAKQSAAIITELKRKSGDLDILDKQVAL